MWHLIIGWKSTIKDKVIGKSKVSNEKWTLGMRGQVLLTKFSQLVWGEGKRERDQRERERRRGLERVSTFSLEFLVIHPSNSGKARNIVGLHYKGYAWVPVLWSFDNSER